MNEIEHIQFHPEESDDEEPKSEEEDAEMLMLNGLTMGTN